jgi:transmembrane sensor
MAVSLLATLFHKNLQHTASAEEKATLKELLQDPRNEQECKDLIEEAFHQTVIEREMNEMSAAQVLEVILKTQDHTAGKGKTVPMVVRRRSYIVAAAAAAILLIVSVFWFTNGAKKNVQQLVQQNLQHDIKSPATPKAILTLSTGEKIFLDSAASGSIAREGNIKVEKLPDGQIVYKGQGKETVFNTISLPRGSRPMQLTLSDGSHIWLNAASSITYPTAFSGGARNVEIKGEVYFEVAKNPDEPFNVRTGRTTVVVLGTHFNVNAYDDEASENTTLLEGSVKVQKTEAGQLPVILAPGQQAKVTQSITVVDNVDTEAVMAWKNGYFSLKGTDLPSLMRQVSRWYNVEISYDGEITDKRFVGAISRDIGLTDLLTSLREFGIKGVLNDRKVIIESK